MHQDLSNRGCHMQTGPRPMSRVYRLYWQYIHTQNISISPAVRQAQLRGQEEPSGVADTVPDVQPERNPAPEARLQIQYRNCVWKLWLQTPQIQRRMQGPQPRMLPLWETWTLLKNVQAESRQQVEWQDWGQTHRHGRTVFQTIPRVRTQPLIISQMNKWKH